MRKISNYQYFILESKINSNDSLNEGFKEILLGLGLLAGVVSGNVNAQTVKQKVQDSATEIEEILNDKTKLNYAVTELEKIGMDDAAKTIETNSKKVLKRLEEFKKKKEKVSEFETSNIEEVLKKLKTGWAISSIDLDTVEKTMVNDPKLMQQEIIIDSLELDFKSSELFDESVFKLNDNFKSEITNALQSIKGMDGTILKIEIESSTDKQRVEKGGSLSKDLEQMNLPVNNEGLSQARNNSLKSVIESVFEENGDSTVPKISQVVKWEQGKGEINSPTPQDPEARYVKIVVYFTEFNSLPDEPALDTPNDKISVIIHNFVMNKVSKEEQNKEKGKIKKGKIRKVKSKANECPLFKKRKRK